MDQNERAKKQLEEWQKGYEEMKKTQEIIDHSREISKLISDCFVDATIFGTGTVDITEYINKMEKLKKKHEIKKKMNNIFNHIKGE